MDQQYHIAKLISQKNKGTISKEEMAELMAWVDESDANKDLYLNATDESKLLEKINLYQKFDREGVRSTLENQLFGARVVKFRVASLLKYAAAIVLPALLALSLWMYLDTPTEPTLASIDEVITPGVQKATLKLSDGKEVELDASKEPTKLKDGDMTITDDQQLLTYEQEALEEAQPLRYNELITPRGGGYNLMLSDGTQVILNAGSSIRYPVSFSDTVRQVYLTGEAYFDVTHDGKPFIVNCNEMDIRVLGTTFNITAYEDEELAKTTLVEGKVMVSVKNVGNQLENAILAPNKQAVISKDARVLEVKDVDASQYTSWVRGKFEFNNEELDVVMKRLARWYDFEYEFGRSEAKTYHFSARIDRSQSISSILTMLQMTTDVKFEMEGNKIVIL